MESLGKRYVHFKGLMFVAKLLPRTVYCNSPHLPTVNVPAYIMHLHQHWSLSFKKIFVSLICIKSYLYWVNLHVLVTSVVLFFFSFYIWENWGLVACLYRGLRKGWRVDGKPAQADSSCSALATGWHCPFGVGRVWLLCADWASSHWAHTLRNSWPACQGKNLSFLWRGSSSRRTLSGELAAGTVHAALRARPQGWHVLRCLAPM